MSTAAVSGNTGFIHEAAFYDSDGGLLEGRDPVPRGGSRGR